MSTSTVRSPAVRRLMKEYMDLQNDPSNEFTAAPLPDNIFEWHFTIRGPSEGGFQGGRYHGRIVFTTEYPFKPPSIYFLTPNGRFELGKKICLSITGYHPEFWRPAWGVRSALIALISFMITPGDGAIGALDYNPEERAILARQSKKWKCPVCESNNPTCLPDESVKPVEKLECDPELTFLTKKTQPQSEETIASTELAPYTALETRTTIEPSQNISSENSGKTLHTNSNQSNNINQDVQSSSTVNTVNSSMTNTLSREEQNHPVGNRELPPSISSEKVESIVRQRRVPLPTKTIPLQTNDSNGSTSTTQNNDLTIATSGSTSSSSSSSVRNNRISNNNNNDTTNARLVEPSHQLLKFVISVLFILILRRIILLWNSIMNSF